MSMSFDGVLFFPVTPLTSADQVDHDVLAEHITSRLPYTPGAVFAACGTGEFHALSTTEVLEVTRTAVSTVAGRVPVIAGVGGPLGQARVLAAGAADAGADALLLLPPYLVSGTTAGLIAYVESVAAASALPIIVYHRGSARFTPEAMVHLGAHPRVVGFKDGIGDVGLAQQIVRATTDAGHDLAFFNGLLTAEYSQAAYRAIGIPLYSSAAFAMIPEVATAYYRAYTTHDDQECARLLRGFYDPLVALRDQTPGFAVSLIKTGLRLRGLDVGRVRAPLVDPCPEQEAELGRILDRGLELVAP